MFRTDRVNLRKFTLRNEFVKVQGSIATRDRLRSFVRKLELGSVVKNRVSGTEMKTIFNKWDEKRCL